MRTVLLIMISACAALVCGVAGTAQFYGARVRAQDAELIRVRHEVATLQDAAKSLQPDLESAKARTERLEQEYAACRTQTDELQAQVATLEAASQRVNAPASTLETDSGAVLDGLLEAAAAPEQDRGERRRRGEGKAPSPEEEAAREARAAEFQQRTDEFFADAIANAATDEMRQRLEDLDATRKEFFELRAAIRDAKSEEERAHLEEQADAIRDSMQQLTREQQRDMLTQVGQSYGINSS